MIPVRSEMDKFINSDMCGHRISITGDLYLLGKGIICLTSFNAFQRLNDANFDMSTCFLLIIDALSWRLRNKT